MKLTTILLGLTILFFMGCGEAEEPEVAVEPVKQEIATPTVNSVHRAVTYSIEDEDGEAPQVTRSDLRLELGQSFYTLDKVLEVDIDGRAVELMKCRTEKGEEFWSKMDLIVPNGQLGVIVGDESIIYSEPNKLKPTGNLIEKTTIVAMYPEIENGFRKVTTWDEIQNVKRSEIFIKTQEISTQDADIGSILAFFAASGASNEVAKKALFNTALDDYPSSVFHQYIQDEYDKSMRNNAPEVNKTSDTSISTERVSFAATVNDDKVNVRRSPSLGGTAVTQVNTGDKVDVVEQTVNTTTIDGVTARWFMLAEPKGWLFGAFLNVD